MKESIDFCFPENDEKDFVSVAEHLGIQALCFVYKEPKQLPKIDTKIEVFTAVLCDEKNINKYRNKHFTIMQAPKDQSRIRIILEQSKPDMLISLESSGRSDFIHHRASGLNQVHAKLAKKNDIIIGFNFSDILKSKGTKKAAILGRMSQNIRFARKFKFPACFASFADSPYRLRSPSDLSSFFAELGLHTSEFTNSHSSLFKRLQKN